MSNRASASGCRTILRLLVWFACPLPRPHEGGDDAVQGAQLLLGAEGALKQVAQIARHARPLVGVAQEPALAQRLLEMLEKAQELGLVGRPAVAGMEGLGLGLGPRGKP